MPFHSASLVMFSSWGWTVEASWVFAGLFQPLPASVSPFPSRWLFPLLFRDLFRPVTQTPFLYRSWCRILCTWQAACQSWMLLSHTTPGKTQSTQTTKESTRLTLKNKIILQLATCGYQVKYKENKTLCLPVLSDKHLPSRLWAPPATMPCTPK